MIQGSGSGARRVRATNKERSLFSRTGLNLAVTIAGSISGGIAAGLLARTVGIKSFGYLSIALAVAGITIMISDLGVTSIATREAVKNPHRGRSIVLSACVSRSLVALPGFFALLAVIFTFPAPIRPACILIALTIPTNIFGGAQALLQAKLQLGRLSLGVLVQSVTWTLWAIVAYILSLGATWFVLGFVLSTIAQVALYGTFGLVATRGDPWFGSLRDVRRMVSQGLPIAVGSIGWTIYNRLPLALVGTLSSPIQSGLLGASYRVLDGSYLIPSTTASVLLPILSGAEDSRVKVRIVETIILVTLLLNFAVLGGLLFLGEPVGRLVFGSEFRGIGRVALVLASAVIPFSLDTVFGNVLIVAGRAKALAATGGVGCGLVGLCLLGLGRYGAVGAAVSLVLTQVARTALLGWRASAADGIVVRLPWRRIGAVSTIVTGFGGMLWWLCELLGSSMALRSLLLGVYLVLLLVVGYSSGVSSLRQEFRTQRDGDSRPSARGDTELSEGVPTDHRGTAFIEP